MSKRKRKRKRTQPQLEEMQRESHRIATTWWRDRIDLTYNGVDLGRCLEYTMLEAINSVTKHEMANGGTG